MVGQRGLWVSSRQDAKNAKREDIFNREWTRRVLINGPERNGRRMVTMSPCEECENFVLASSLAEAKSSHSQTDTNVGRLPFHTTLFTLFVPIAPSCGKFPSPLCVFASLRETFSQPTDDSQLSYFPLFPLSIFLAFQCLTSSPLRDFCAFA